MDILDSIAERRIQEALERGEFEGLPGAGIPLELEDLAHVPEELRAGYILLKGAGVLPEEMQLRKHAVHLGDLIAACEDDAERASLDVRRRALLLRMDLLRERRG